MNLAPVVLFVYNRPWHTRQTLESLSNNLLSDKSVLYIFADGPKTNASLEEISKINEVREIVRLKKWCNEVKIIESELNKGLADSIISGVSQIVNKHGKIIVLEDDLISSKYFLQYINNSLVYYENTLNVMHITGHSFPLKGIRKDTYFLNYVSPWGWGTWNNRWQYFEKDASILLKNLNNFQEFDLEKFNCGYGNEFYEQLIRNVDNRLNTWAVKWHTTIFLKSGLCLFPTHSLIDNIGFDDSGENCTKSNLYFIDINNNKEPKLSEIPLEINQVALKSFKMYYENYFLTKREIPLIRRILLRLINKQTRIKIKKRYGRFQSIFMGRKKSGTN
jgi:hypothetical protein